MIISFKEALEKRQTARALNATQFRTQLGKFLTQRGFEAFFDFDPADHADQTMLAAVHIVGSAIFSHEVSSAKTKLTRENLGVVAEATCILIDQLATLAALSAGWQGAAEKAITQILDAYLDSATITAIRDAAILTHRERSHRLSPKRIEELSQSVLCAIEDETDNALAHIAGLLISSVKAVA